MSDDIKKEQGAGEFVPEVVVNPLTEFQKAAQNFKASHAECEALEKTVGEKRHEATARFGAVLVANDALPTADRKSFTGLCEHLGISRPTGYRYEALWRITRGDPALTLRLSLETAQQAGKLWRANPERSEDYIFALRADPDLTPAQFIAKFGDAPSEDLERAGESQESGGHDLSVATVKVGAAGAEVEQAQPCAAVGVGSGAPTDPGSATEDAEGHPIIASIRRLGGLSVETDGHLTAMTEEEQEALVKEACAKEEVEIQSAGEIDKALAGIVGAGIAKLLAKRGILAAPGPKAPRSGSCGDISDDFEPAEPNVTDLGDSYELVVTGDWQNEIAAVMADTKSFEKFIGKGLLIRKEEA